VSFPENPEFSRDSLSTESVDNFVDENQKRFKNTLKTPISKIWHYFEQILYIFIIQQVIELI